MSCQGRAKPRCQENKLPRCPAWGENSPPLQAGENELVPEVSTCRIRPGAAAQRGWESSGRGDERAQAEGMAQSSPRPPALAGRNFGGRFQFGLSPREIHQSPHPKTVGLDLNSAAGAGWEGWLQAWDLDTSEKTSDWEAIPAGSQ